MQKAQPLLAVTLGDITGIGPEILVKILAKGPQDAYRLMVVGDVQVLRASYDALNVPFNLPVFRSVEEATTSNAPALVLDMAQVRYISSSGLRTMADVLTKNQEQGGDLKLVALNRKVQRVLRIIGFDKFFSIYDTLEAAIADFG